MSINTADDFSDNRCFGVRTLTRNQNEPMYTVQINGAFNVGDTLTPMVQDHTNAPLPLGTAQMRTLTGRFVRT